jgi:DNA-binding transcriptional regulator LsrR (DeoR family)
MLVSEVAVILEVSVWQVHKYIKDKHLKSTIKERVRHIATEDFELFYKNYFLNRHKRKGKSIANNDELNTLEDFTKDITSNISYDEFSKKYKDIDAIIPPLKHFKLLKRNIMIIKDNETMTQKDIAIKYNLSLRTIESIIKKSKERSN